MISTRHYKLNCFLHLVQIVLAPLFVLTSVALLGMIYALIFACLVAGHGVFSEHRWTAMRSAVCSAAVVIPGVLSEVLFVIKLTPGDYNLLSFFSCCLPLVFICICLGANSCGVRGANPWQFGLRKDLFSFCLERFPLLSVYGNVAFHKRSSQDTAEARALAEMREASNSTRRSTAIVSHPVSASMTAGSTVRSPLLTTTPGSSSSATAGGEHIAFVSPRQHADPHSSVFLPLTVIVHRDVEGGVGDAAYTQVGDNERGQLRSASNDSYTICRPLDQPD